MIFITPRLAQPTLRDHVRECGGFRGYRQESKAISRIEDMIRYPITHNDEDARQIFSEGIQLFQGLTDIGKYKIMRELAKDLCSIRSFVFESQEESKKLTVIATFFSEAATALPKNEFGDTINEPYQDIIARLKSFVENNNHYRSDNEVHSGAKIACMHAIWNLGEGNLTFWDGPLLSSDQSIQLAALGIFLNEPLRTNVPMDQHAWWALREHLDAVGPVLLHSSLEKKYEFFHMMLCDEDLSIVRKTLEILAQAPHLPPHFFLIAKQLAEQNPELAGPGNMLQTIISLRQKVNNADDSQYQAASQLLMIYRQDGMRYLLPLLQEVGKEMVSVYVDPACAVPADLETRRTMLNTFGIKMPGSTLRSPNSDVADFDEFRNADEEALEQLHPQHLLILVQRIWAGRDQLSPDDEQQLDRIGTVLLRFLRRSEERQKAMAVLVEYGMAGIEIPGFQLNIRTTESGPKGYSSLSLNQLFEIWEKAYKGLNEGESVEKNSQIIAELMPIALSKSKDIDSLGLEDLRRLYIMIRGCRSISDLNETEIDTFNRIAVAALKIIKSENLLQTPRPDILDAPTLVEASQAFLSKPFHDYSAIQATPYEARRVEDYLHLFLYHCSRGEKHE